MDLMICYFIFLLFTVFTIVFVFIFVFVIFLFIVDPFSHWLFTYTLGAADPSGGAHAIVRFDLIDFIAGIFVVTEGQGFERFKFLHTLRLGILALTFGRSFGPGLISDGVEFLLRLILPLLERISLAFHAFDLIFDRVTAVGIVGGVIAM